MNKNEKVAVTSRSFAKHPLLRKAILEKYKNVTFNDEGISLKGQALVDFLKGHDKAIVSLDQIDDQLLTQVPTLKTISKYGVGLNSLDFDALKKHNILLGWTGGVNKRSVSELALTLMLSCLRYIPQLNQDVLNGNFKQKKGRCLTGKTIGLIGLGNIGKDIVELLKPFQCQIQCYDIKIDEAYCHENQVQDVDLETLLNTSDIISIHLPLIESTENFIDDKKLSQMKKDVILINTARGGLVNETHLLNFLKENSSASAGFDVFLEEPLKNLDLVKLPNFVATPHIGGSTEEAIINMGITSIENLDKAVPVDNYL